MYRKFVRVLLSLGSLFFMLSALQAGTEGNGKIEGYIFDSQNNEPLPGANVYLKGTTYGAATDLKGKFVISQIPAGEYQLVVRYIGYLEKTLAVSVKDGQTLNQVIKLDFQIIEGEAVTVTAQAEGQIAAINQQLSSNTISNIVSQARIRELPDVNAAESVGRLPGVSIQRSGGEATKIEIRGLSPKYNTVTVNGVRVPATGGDDRSVDLSLISSNILAGIEVKKANTPDMDADVLGGTVDLKLREASAGRQVNISGQGGYNELQEYYGNYNFTGNVSNRFFDSKLGVIATFNLDDYDRSADKFSADYRQATNLQTQQTEVLVQSLNLREEQVTRGRTGASILVDYSLPYGQITANSFYNRLHWDGVNRINRLGLYPDSRHYYDLEDRSGSTAIFTGTLGGALDFGWIQFDANVARTTSRTEALGERTWTFAQEPAPLVSGFTVKTETHPNEVPKRQPVDTSRTWLSSLFVQDTEREENQTTTQLNIKLPFRLSNQLTGYLKLGGKLRWLDRFNNEEQIGRAGIQYGSTNGPNNVLTLIGQQFSEWNVDSLVRQHGGLPITPFNSTYTRSDFLQGEYPLGFALDLVTMNKLTNYLTTTEEWLRYSIGSYGRDYDGTERYQAAYIMSEMNFGNLLRFIPGVRWEKDHSEYNGQRFKEVDQAFQQRPPVDFANLTNERKNEFWLPMAHLIVSPNDWLQVRLARTETLTRPDFIQFTPITTINSFSSYVRAANGLLKPAHSKNYDAAVSVYQNKVGLFTIAGFHKSIKDLIFQTRYYLIRNLFPQLPGMNIPQHWYSGASPLVDTYINNPFPAKYRGVELDWQTNFVYLPSPFKGVVLNVNYTHISSEMERKIYRLEKVLVRPFPPVYRDSLAVTSRVTRMPDQPAHIANITIGYDIGGFSARLSYLYQSDKTTFISTESILDGFSGSYARWDLTLQQKLGWGMQVFANFNNLNNRADENFRGNTLFHPTYTEYYGFTMDAGIRFKL